MEDTLLNTLRDGLREEIAQYGQLFDLATREHEILAGETSSTELAALAAAKLNIMRDINDLTMRIAPLKVRWKLETSDEEQGPASSDIRPLLEELGTLLEKILDVDEENQRILSRLVKAAGAQAANRSLTTASAARAYDQAAAKS